MRMRACVYLVFLFNLYAMYARSVLVYIVRACPQMVMEALEYLIV